jgi:hypothetical protein
MTTKKEMISLIKAENPTLRSGSDEDGYVELTGSDYEAQIELWADLRLAKETKLAEIDAIATAKIEAAEKLVALGIDPKALGL